MSGTLLDDSIDHFQCPRLTDSLSCVIVSLPTVQQSCVALHKTITSFIGPKRAPRVITELVNRANVHFISQNLRASEWFPSFNEFRQHQLTSSSSASFARNFFLSPAFASGLTYSTSLCDSLLINQYFNSHIKSILREFIFASWKDVRCDIAHRDVVWKWTLFS